MLRARGLAASFDGRSVFVDLDLDVTPGTIHVILGPSGCGKTTLLRCLAGLKDPSRGRIELDSNDVTHVPAHRRGVVLLHQESSLFPHLDALGNVAFGPRVQGTDPSSSKAAARELLDRVGLEGFHARKPHELSGGQRQRVAIARALAVSPRALLLDEPLSQLDQPTRVGLRSLLRLLIHGQGTSAVYVTHDREEAFALADTVALMENGRFLDQGEPARVWSAPASASAARLLGRRNILSWRDDAGKMVCALGMWPNPSPGSREGLLMLREEELRIADKGVQAIVEQTEYLGGRYMVQVLVDGVQCWLEHPTSPTLGSQVFVDSTGCRPVSWPL